MTSATPDTASDGRVDATKGVWVEPLVDRIDVRDAEAGDGSGPDGGFIS